MLPLAVSTMALVFIVIPLVVIWALTTVDIVRRDLPVQLKATWITIVLLVPLIGAVAYYAMRKPTEEEMRQRRAAAAETPRGGMAGGRHPPM
jgi:hypothetical protein